MEAPRPMQPTDQPRTRPQRLLAVAAALALLTGLGGVTQAFVSPLSGPLDDAGDQGNWKAPFDSEIPAVNMALTPGGDVVYYSGSEANESHEHDGDGTEPHAHPNDHTFFTTYPNRSASRVYDPDSGAISSPDNDPDVDLFCSGTTVRPDGHVMSVGGTDWEILGDGDGQPFVDNPEVLGTKEVWTLPPEDGNEAWQDEPDLNVRRWYPTVVETADGGALAASGIKNLSEFNTHNTYLERQDPGNDTWDLIEPSFKVADGVSVEHQGRAGNTELAPANLPIYPKLFVVPSGPHEGEILYPANGDLWAPFGERPEEAAWGTFQVIDYTTGETTFAGASPFGPRHLGNAVPLMLDHDDGFDLEVLSLGGTLERTGLATNTAEVVDASGERVTSEPVEPMEHPRWNPNSVLLPTGDVVTVGGSAIDDVLIHGQDKAPILEAELFDADEREWRTLAAMELPRDYHSTAVLLPNATVLVGGHVPLPDPPKDIRDKVPGQDQRVVTQFEVFEPPYLDNDEDTRPNITRIDNEPADEAQEEAVASIPYDDSFTVTVEGLDEGLDDVVLVRPGSVTHTVDADQRGIRLNVTSEDVLDASTGKTLLTVESPPGGAVAPPGHYMLFANEDIGDQALPSTAEFVQVGPETFFQ